MCRDVRAALSSPALDADNSETSISKKREDHDILITYSYVVS